MPHIHTGNKEHDLTVSGFIVRTDETEPRLLLHWHKLLSKWLQFGGHVELDEHPWTALAHELEEESGYDMSQLTLLQQDVEQPEYDDNSEVIVHPQTAHSNTHKFGKLINGDKSHYHTDLEFVFVTDEDPQSAVANNESGEMKLFTQAELKSLSNEEIPPNVKAIGLFALKISQSDNWRQVPATNFSY